jgi:2-polyprenyl-3-methyl-5-hydroxy-6-metoxy-1,4-benzoquinol methylase
VDFTRRSYEPELLDGQNIPFEDIRRNMHELDVINTWLGGHDLTVKAFRKLLRAEQEIHVCEIGCGGGDNLRAIHRWCKKHGVALRVTGIDINPNCINYAREHSREIEKAVWIVSDYRLAVLTDPPDIVFNSLFCHHFSDEDVVAALRWMADGARMGFFINDLHRHALAYHSIKMLTSLFSRSRLVRNDAPLSVRRGFRRNEWQQLIRQALPGEEAQWTLRWAWAFRWMIIYSRKDSLKS